VLGIVQGLVPVALVIFLLWSSAQPRLGKLGPGQQAVGF